MKNALMIFLKVYSIFCMVVVTMLLITGIIICLNIGRITSFFINYFVDNYNTQLTEIISTHLSLSIPDNSIQLESIKSIQGGGLQATFIVNNDVMAGIDIEAFQGKTNMEILTELGISNKAIPDEIKRLLSLSRGSLVLDFKDNNGNMLNNSVLTNTEITEFLNTGT